MIWGKFSSRETQFTDSSQSQSQMTKCRGRTITGSMKYYTQNFARQNVFVMSDILRGSKAFCEKKLPQRNSQKTGYKTSRGWPSGEPGLGWVYFDLCCSALCLVLPWLMGNWQKWLSRLASSGNIPNQSQPNPVVTLTLPSVQKAKMLLGNGISGK